MQGARYLLPTVGVVSIGMNQIKISRTKVEAWRGDCHKEGEELSVVKLQLFLEKEWPWELCGWLCPSVQGCPGKGGAVGSGFLMWS